MVIKICKICGKEFNARGSDKCCGPECSKINHQNLNKEYYDNHRDERLAYTKEWQKNNSDKNRESSRKWRENHPEYYKEWYKNNRDKKSEYNREWYENNRDEIRESRREYQKEYRQKKIAELNEKYDGDLNLLLKDCIHTWEKREAIMQVEYGVSYVDGMIAKIESTPVCEVTGESNNLVIHHLYSFNTHPELGNDVANMVRITGAVHDEFHKTYGYGDNTPEQWYEFLEKRGDS